MSFSALTPGSGPESNYSILFLCARCHRVQRRLVLRLLAVIVLRAALLVERPADGALELITRAFLFDWEVGCGQSLHFQGICSSPTCLLGLTTGFPPYGNATTRGVALGLKHYVVNTHTSSQRLCGRWQASQWISRFCVGRKLF